MVDTAVPDETKAEYEEELDRLEWKYIQQKANLVLNVKKGQKRFEKTIDKLEEKFITSEYDWWCAVVLSKELNDQKSDQLLKKVFLDVRDQYSHMSLT